MHEFKRREEKKGRAFPGGLKDVQADPQCNKEWQSMNPVKKAEYNNRAKNQKQTGGKKTGVGECMDTVRNDAKRKEDFKHNMIEDIENEVAEGMEFDTLASKKFNFIHTNWFYTRSLEGNEFDYIPAEFAVSEFSLEHGVTGIYHEILKTEILIGYRREAMETSQETHQLPWDLSCACDDFSYMCNKLKEFLEPNRKDGYPPLYTSGKIKPAVEALVKRLIRSQNLPENTFRVYDLEVLFMSLRNAAQQKSDMAADFKTVMAEYELIKDAFSFTPGLDCDFHKNLDGTSQFCSMSIVKRWAFTICDYCCPNMGIKEIVGVHVPLRSNPELLDSALNGLTDQIDLMNLQDTIGIKSITGVSKEYRMRVSERTDAEEQRRRKDKTHVTVINFAEKKAEPDSIVVPSAATKTPEFQLPLRRPTTASQALGWGQRGAPQQHSFNESDFPSLGVSAGRGVGNRRRQNETKPSVGRGRGIAQN